MRGRLNIQATCKSCGVTIGMPNDVYHDRVQAHGRFLCLRCIRTDFKSALGPSDIDLARENGKLLAEKAQLTAKIDALLGQRRELLLSLYGAPEAFAGDLSTSELESRIKGLVAAGRHSRRAAFRDLRNPTDTGTLVRKDPVPPKGWQVDNNALVQELVSIRESGKLWGALSVIWSACTLATVWYCLA